MARAVAQLGIVQTRHVQHKALGRPPRRRGPRRAGLVWQRDPDERLDLATLWPIDGMSQDARLYGGTFPAAFLDAPLVILNLRAVLNTHTTALGILMTCATAWLQAQIEAETDQRSAKRIVVVDEAWRILSNLGIGEWLQQSFKLSRGLGTQNVVVMHRLSDLRAAGAEGSREVRSTLIPYVFTDNDDAFAILCQAKMFGIHQAPFDNVVQLCQGLQNGSEMASVLH